MLHIIFLKNATLDKGDEFCFEKCIKDADRNENDLTIHDVSNLMPNLFEIRWIFEKIKVENHKRVCLYAFLITTNLLWTVDCKKMMCILQIVYFATVCNFSQKQFLFFVFKEINGSFTQQCPLWFYCCVRAIKKLIFCKRVFGLFYRI